MTAQNYPKFPRDSPETQRNIRNYKREIMNYIGGALIIAMVSTLLAGLSFRCDAHKKGQLERKLENPPASQPATPLNNSLLNSRAYTAQLESL